jgi:hypothetical protein
MSSRAATPLLAACALAWAAAGSIAAHGQAGQGSAWRESFNVTPAELSTVGRNPFFVLEPGYQLTLEGKEDGKAVRLVVSVLDETRKVGAFDTRVVEERESNSGDLAEVSRNFFAINAKTGDVYYFGEEVDIYAGGRVVRHEGAWLHGDLGARFGLMMPGRPSVGLRYYQELAPKVAMDRAEVVSLSASLKTPAGAFDGCLKTLETTPLEPGAREFKIYAPGVGLAQDGALVLTSHTPPR